MRQGFVFSKNTIQKNSIFDTLFDLFKQMLVYTSGDANEAISWLTEVDREYKITTPEYGMGDFINDLKKHGYLKENEETENASFQITSKLEKSIREGAFEKIFGKLKKGKPGNHSTKYHGIGDESTPDTRSWSYGDEYEKVDMQKSIYNAQLNHGIEQFKMSESDLEVFDKEHQSQTATVLMIDISHSMILYGEDRITPAKNVAMALSEFIKRKYPKDSLEIIVFGDDAWKIELKDLPYLQVGPYHTNTVAGLELAMDLLRRKRATNKQILMITDGKPSCMKMGGEYYKNSFGLDRQIVNRCLTLAHACRRLNIPITTFMIAQDNYLKQFIEDFTKANGGKAFFSGLQNLGDFIFEDFEKGKKRKLG